MACSCKCCCGCCCDGETGEQKLERQCTSPKEFQGKGTICDVCCDLGEIREDITEEGECPGTWVVNGRCLDNPCASECETDGDCNEGQYCCDGVCQDEPCDGCYCDLSAGDWPEPETTGPGGTLGSTISTNVADNASRQSYLNSMFSNGKIAWKAGYPDVLDGCVTAWWYFGTDGEYVSCPEASGGYCRVGYFEYRLLHATCPDGTVVDITDQAIDEIVAGWMSREYWCEDTDSGGECPGDCCDGDGPPDPPEVTFELPP
jgi:hypothetical protein